MLVLSRKITIWYFYLFLFLFFLGEIAFQIRECSNVQRETVKHKKIQPSNVKWIQPSASISSLSSGHFGSLLVIRPVSPLEDEVYPERATIEHQMFDNENKSFS